MTDWTAVAAIVTALGVLVALAIGIVSTIVGIRAARAAERAAKAAETQSAITGNQLAAIYPVLEAYVPVETMSVWKLVADPNPGSPGVIFTRPGRNERAWVMVRVMHGSIVATGIETWLFLKGQWFSGRYSAISPNMPLNSAIQVEVSQVTLPSWPAEFADVNLTLGLGMVGVVWDRPDGRWHYAAELGEAFAQTSNFVLGRVPDH